MNQLEEYTSLGQWGEDKRASLLVLLLTGGVGMYFVTLPERENMVYPVRDKTLRSRFKQETDKGNSLPETDNKGSGR